MTVQVPKPGRGPGTPAADAGSIVVYQCDRDLRYSWVASPPPGFSADQLVGRTDAEILPAEAARALTAFKREAVESGRAVRREIFLRYGCFDRTLDAVAQPMRDAAGAVSGLTVVAADVTEDRRVEEDALRCSEERFRTLAVATAAIVWETDAHGQVVVPNPSWEAYTGQTWEEYRGLGYAQGFHPEDLKRSWPLWTKALEEKTVLEAELRVWHAGTRTWRYCAVRGIPILASDGSVREWIGTHTDIHDRRRAEMALRESEWKLRLAVEATGLGLWDHDVRTDGIVWSDRMRSMFDVPPDLPIDFGRFVDHLHPDDRDGTVVRYAQALDPEGDGRFGLEHRIVSPVDGGVRWLLAAGLVMFDDDRRPVRVIGGSLDITERKKAEEALWEAKEEAVRARETAERANLAKSRFLAAASHDLRQPVQSLFFFLPALRGYLRNPEAQPILDHMTQGLQALKGLLDSLLDISRLDAGVVEARIEAFPLSDLLAEIDAAFAPIAAEKGLRWLVEPAATTVRSDPVLLGRVIRNLVDNALRYTPAGEVSVTVHPEGRTVAIAIADTGIGIPQGSLDEIFVEFRQIGNAERDREKGLGLGLAVVRRITQLLNHPLRVRSRVGEGSVFSIEVPLAEAPGAAGSSGTGPIETGRGAGRLLVVVEDDVLVLAGLEASLTAAGYDVVAGTSEEAVRPRLADRGVAPFAILVDYRLPNGRTGLEVYRSLVSSCADPVRGVVLTGETGGAHVKAAAAAGCAVLHKPVTIQDLLAALDR